MERTPQSNEVALSAAPPLLITESADEFAALLAALQQEIRPTGIIEQIYLHDLAAIVWEIQRMRRYRTEIVNNAFRAALQSLLTRLLPIPYIRDRVESEKKAAELAHAWFTKKNGKKDVLAILRRFNLDQSAIEAEAVRQAWPDLELADKMQTSLRSRFDRTLRSVADYRDSLARRMRQSSERILNNDEVPRLADFAGKEPA